jgi:hypothetical protein
MRTTQRIISTLYILSLAYCGAWIPWSLTSHDRYGTTRQRLGYGWVWAGPQYHKSSSIPPAPPPNNTQKSGTASIDDIVEGAPTQPLDPEAEKQREWDAISRLAAPDATLIAFRVADISLLFAASLPLVWFRKHRGSSATLN